MIASMLQFFRATAAAVAFVLWAMVLTVIQSVVTFAVVLKQGFIVLFANGVGVTPQAMEALGRTTQLVVSPGAQIVAEGFGRALSRLVSMIGAGVIGVIVASGYAAQDCRGMFECTGGLRLGESLGLLAILLVVGLVFAYAEVILADRLPELRASTASIDEGDSPIEAYRCAGGTVGESAVDSARLDEVLAQLSLIQVELGTPWWRKVLRRAR